MAGTYGAAGTNTYLIPGIGGILSNEVNATNGITQVYRGGAATTQQSIGTYNPSTGQFTPDANANLTDSEKKALSDTKNIKIIKDKSIETATKAGATNAQQLLSPNSATAGSTGSATDFNKTLSDLKIGDKKGGIRQSYGNLKYPKDAKFMSEQDCIKFTMYRAKPKKVELTSDLGTFSGSNKGNSMGTVMLPIQPGISDSNLVSWGENSMDAISAAGAALALSAIKGGAENLGESGNTAAKAVKDYKGDIQKAIAASFAGQATGANQGFLTRATGAVLNSNMEILFQGPSLRSFTFNFSMSARFSKEAEEIRKIIRFFKQGMSVKRSESALFLQTPNIFDIQYYYKGSEHTYINKIKTCALQNCVVNYTPAGNYATYDDGAMTQYDMTLTFGEIEPLFDDDYGQSDDGLIGY